MGKTEIPNDASSPRVKISLPHYEDTGAISLTGWALVSNTYEIKEGAL